MQHHPETETHNFRTGLMLFGGLSAAFGWTFFLVWYALVGLANHMR